MRKVDIEHVTPGMKLAKTIFSEDGRVLLTAGMLLRQNYIDRLRNTGVGEVFIDDDISHDVYVSDVICEQTRSEVKFLVKGIMEGYTFSNMLKLDRVKEMIDTMIEEILSSKEIVINLADIKSVDDYTFEHSVNVCVLSLVTGIGLGFNIMRLRDLGIGALLHDIGKMRISESILKKPSQLSVEEFEEIKKHTVYGYEILKDNKNISMISAFIAFGHHERVDGSGYPLKLRGENIHQCARIVAVADVFDALTSDRVYRKRLRPAEVIEYITSLGSRHFDEEIVKTFTSYLSPYPVGTGVQLNTGEKALVIRVNRNFPHRPVVRIVFGTDNQRLVKLYEIDLMQKDTVTITDACEL